MVDGAFVLHRDRAASLRSSPRRKGGAIDEVVAMPLYDFHCAKCQKDFTLALRVQDYDQKSFVCPECNSKEVERVFENVGVVTSKKS
jgi:putative FmdB family regulatory protein